MELNEQQFITGFNSGYLLAKFEPVLLKILLKGIHPNTLYINGLSSGQREYEQEQTKNRLNDVKRLRSKNLNKDKDRG